MDIGKKISEIEIGEKASFAKTITEVDIYFYGGVSGDFNPLHMNEEYAKKTKFGHRIAHGPISIALVATVFGTKLPGLGTLAREISAQFKAPVYIGDTITAQAEVLEKDIEKNIVKLKFTCTNQKGIVVTEGFGIMMPPLEKFKEL
jgi:3-hydroxybutyryl-CoA dehydratase